MYTLSGNLYCVAISKFQIEFLYHIVLAASAVYMGKVVQRTTAPGLKKRQGLKRGAPMQPGKEIIVVKNFFWRHYFIIR